MSSEGIFCRQKWGVGSLRKNLDPPLKRLHICQILLMFLQGALRQMFTVADPVAGWGGAKKHEMYATAFGDHLFYN